MKTGFKPLLNVVGQYQLCNYNFWLFDVQATTKNKKYAFYNNQLKSIKQQEQQKRRQRTWFCSNMLLLSTLEAFTDQFLPDPKSKILLEVKPKFDMNPKKHFVDLTFNPNLTHFNPNSTPKINLIFMQLWKNTV